MVHSRVWYPDGLASDWASETPFRMMAGVSALHVQAAVDAPHLSGDVGGGVGGEEMDDARNLFGAAQPTRGDLGGELRDNLLRHRRDPFGGDQAGGHRVDRDADSVVGALP